MSDWTLIPCLRKLRDEFNALAPGRDKGADGSIGDTAHAAGGTSDHLPDEDFAALRGKDADHANEVHALDIDSTGPWPDGLTMDRIVAHILSYCRRNNSDPLNEPRLRYIIWNRKIYRAPNWAAETYTGSPDPHTNHAHFSAEYVSSLEADTSTWHLEDLVALTPAEISDIADAVWAKQLLNPYNNTQQSAGTILRFAPSASWHQTTQAKVDALMATFQAFAAAEAADDTARAQAQQHLQDAIDGMAPTIAALVVQQLPEGADQVTQQEVNEAVKAAFRGAFAVS